MCNHGTLATAGLRDLVSRAELHFGVLVAANAARRAERLRRLALVERLFDPSRWTRPWPGASAPLAAAVVQMARQPRARVMDLCSRSSPSDDGAVSDPAQARPPAPHY